MSPLISLRLRLHATRHGATLRMGKRVVIASPFRFGFPGSSVRIGDDAFFGSHGLLTADGGVIHLGDRLNIDEFWVCKMHLWQQGGGVTVGDGCRFEDHVRVTAFGAGNIVLGQNVFIGRGSHLAAWGTLTVGEGSAIAEYVSIRDHEHVTGENQAVHTSPLRIEAITIGKRVWIGAKATITAGVTIGDGAVVGANAVVTHDVAPHTVVGGVPAILIAGTTDLQEEQQ
ncbi:MAG: acyltransferase [Mariprofundales bacterium]